MIDKQTSDLLEVVSRVNEGDTVAIGGFGGAGSPNMLIDALIKT